LRLITPSLHLSGDGFFFKLEAPYGTSDQLTTYGLGIYPINVGYLIPRARLFLYGSFGLVTNIALFRADGVSASGGGMLVQGRAALGLKWRPVRYLCLIRRARLLALGGGLRGGRVEARGRAGLGLCPWWHWPRVGLQRGNRSSVSRYSSEFRHCGVALDKRLEKCCRPGRRAIR
jgi:hypothetical protein